jgi:hypothetical protein
MKQHNQFRENAENCAELAMKAPDEPSKARYQRMEAAWQQEQDWLDGEIDPVRRELMATQARHRRFDLPDIWEQDGSRSRPSIHV